MFSKFSTRSRCKSACLTISFTASGDQFKECGGRGESRQREI